MDAAPWFAPAAGACALYAGALVVGRPAGLGLTLLLLALLLLAASLRKGPGPFRRVVEGCAVVLALVPVVRAAGWVVAPCVAGALALTSLRLVDGTGWSAVARGATGWLRHLLPGPFVVAGAALGRLAGREWGRLAPHGRGALLALPLLAIFGSLFAAADAAFAELAGRPLEWLPALTDDSLARVAAGLAVLAVAGALLRTSQEPPEREAPRAPRALGPLEWRVALAALNALFALFVALQVTALFGGHDFVLRTADLTYAEYAREGFGQLMIAAALTLGVVALARGGDRTVRALLATLCALTLVVLASALYRLGLYEEAFGFTRSRFAAHVEILWLGAVFAAILVAGALRRESALPRTCVVLTAAFLIAFAAANPDARIARANLERGGEVDALYLEGLSADAAGVLDRCEESGGGPLSLNVGRLRARC